jgi:hypothetical protein
MRRKDAISGPPTPRNARADAGTPPALLTCTEVQAREWDFVEGSLPPSERAAIQAHLEGCALCRRELADCQGAAAALLSASTQIPPAGDLRAGFYARLAAQQRQPRRYGRPVALSALAVGILALALVRPAFRPHVAPPVGVPNTTVLNIGPPHPVTIPERHVTIPDIVLPPHRFVNSEAKADGRLATANTKSHKLSRRRRTIARSVEGRVIAWLDLRPMGNPVQPVDPNLTHYMYYGNADRATADFRLLADAKSALPALKVQKEASVIASVATPPERNAQILQFSTAMPSDAGVSLEVTDQVRGFSNTTHVASDVEVQGETSTIHVTADGF